MGEELFLSAVKYCILKYSKKKCCETSFNLAVGSHSQMAALVWHDMEECATCVGANTQNFPRSHRCSA